MADIEKGKAKGKRSRTHVHVHYYENLNKPTHPAETPGAVQSLRDSEDMCEEPDETKATGGNPVARPDGRSWTEARVSPPGYQPGPREIAFGHRDLRQGSTTVTPFANARSADPTFVGNEALSAAQRIARPFATQEPHNVTVDRLNMPIMPQIQAIPSGDPTSRRPAHIAPNSPAYSAGRTVDNPTSNPPRSAMKASDRVAIMRQAMYGQGRRG